MNASTCSRAIAGGDVGILHSAGGATKPSGLRSRCGRIMGDVGVDRSHRFLML